MTQTDSRRPRERGQLLAVAGVAFMAMILVGGLVIDGGFAFVQRRAAQNASDFAAIAGTRIVMAHALDGSSYTGSDVRTAIETVLTANGVALTDYSANYVDSSGTSITGSPVVTGGAIPPSARGVQVSASRTGRTFFASIAGINTMTAAAKATARGGFGPGGSVPAGDLLPIAVNFSGLSTLEACPPGVSATYLNCPSSFLDLGLGSSPSQFGWMAWPLFSGDAGDLVKMLTPPLPSPAYSIAANSYIGISGNTGASNKIQVRDAIAALVASGAMYYVPILSPGPSQTYPGTSIKYPPTCLDNKLNEDLKCTGPVTMNVIGFAGFQLTGCLHNPCIGDLQGVLREAFFLGPTGAGGGSNGIGKTVNIELVQ